MYRPRREEFMQKIGSGSVGLFRSAPEVKQRKYRQDSNFHYLTGFDEPDSICLIVPDHPEHKFVLFVRPKDRYTEQWSGIRAGVENAIEQHEADIAYPIEEFDERISVYLDKAERIYYIFGVDPAFDEKILPLFKDYAGRKRLLYDQGPNVIVDARDILHDMRHVKSEAELKIFRQAAAITVEAHLAAMKAMEPGIHEYEIEALIEYVFRKNGVLRPSYGTIIGSGANSTIIHYRDNDEIIKDGSIVVIDAGAEYHYYAADVTRTIPANGRFSAAQREVYEIVLEAQWIALENVRPNTPFIAPHNKALTVLVEGLVRLGVLSGEVSQLIEERKYYKYVRQSTSHWLGMEAQDAGKFRRRDGSWMPLQPNMILTIEPGLYFSEDMLEVPEKYRNIGVRIEDDVVVTADGYENLTAEIPKTISEIEVVMKERLTFTFS
ncbi:MAG: aminopeptidase P N-terminal domain-containing protein [Candidatus Poribacteria bacterium]|nr:aminopeptidase P N-terminal domain-containing protein [Candidatus Poribacteria bacterium]